VRWRNSSIIPDEKHPQTSTHFLVCDLKRLSNWLTLMTHQCCKISYMYIYATEGVSRSIHHTPLWPAADLEHRSLGMSVTSLVLFHCRLSMVKQRGCAHFFMIETLTIHHPPVLSYPKRSFPHPNLFLKINIDYKQKIKQS